MRKKWKKALKYLYSRGYELGTSVREYQKGGKLSPAALRRYRDSAALVEAHSIEKGLGLRNVEPGHSGAVARNLLSTLQEMARDPEERESFSFRESLRIVMAYMDFQEGFDTSSFPMYPALREQYDSLCGVLGADYMEKLRGELDAGASYISGEELLEGAAFDFEAFIRTRHSIRSFRQEPLDEQLIRRAVQIANLSPSACNRQPSAVYFCNYPEKVAEMDRLITGSAGFKGEVPNYLVLTTDRACFAFVEQYQWYINGGIYLAYLSLALHSLGIGHCIMQWKAFHKTENTLKKLLGISSTEAIVAVIGCGYYMEEVRCIRAQRKTAEDTLRVVK
ncbi:MAG: nitroreductase family protein [Eubacteriales bacterium]|nr:nitroreductase family protein [Eubacteriales bacterium]